MLSRIGRVFIWCGYVDGQKEGVLFDVNVSGSSQCAARRSQFARSLKILPRLLWPSSRHVDDQPDETVFHPFGDGGGGVACVLGRTGVLKPPMELAVSNHKRKSGADGTQTSLKKHVRCALLKSRAVSTPHLRKASRYATGLKLPQ